MDKHPEFAPEEDLASITSVIEITCQEHGFQPVVLGADRHGSLVWEAACTNGLNRYVTLSLTHLPAAGSTEPAKSILETWVAADNRVHFIRREGETHILPSSVSYGRKSGRHINAGMVVSTTRRAQALTSADLTESYSLASGLNPAGSSPPR